MNMRIPINRRGFLGAAAASTTVGGLLGPGVARLRATEPGKTGETPHFWYRLAPDGPYIDSQRGDRAFGFKDDRIFLSEDNARTWAHSASFPDAENITFSCFLKDGGVLFATREKLFLSTDQLRSHQPIIVKDQEGRDYLPHSPKDPNLPGWYFHPLDGVHTWDVDGREMLVWGNYCNVAGGPVPVNIFYSTDGGRTVKIAYSFGRNPHFQEKGAQPGSFPLSAVFDQTVARFSASLKYSRILWAWRKPFISSGLNVFANSASLFLNSFAKRAN